jgi:pyrroloquinoline quinone biosynthesis protein A
MQTYGMDIADSSLTARRRVAPTYSPFKETTMTWSKPEFIDWRFGFEITLYIANR